jgi:hypothetical protein
VQRRTVRASLLRRQHLGEVPVRAAGQYAYSTTANVPGPSLSMLSLLVLVCLFALASFSLAAVAVCTALWAFTRAYRRRRPQGDTRPFPSDSARGLPRSTQVVAGGFDPQFLREMRGRLDAVSAEFDQLR